MGTKPFRVFLEMRQEARMSLQQAKTLVRETALDPKTEASRSTHGSDVATERIERAESVGELIEACRRAWEWR